MQFFTTTVLALAATSVTANPIETRAVNATNTVSSLYSEVQGFTAVINSTLASLGFNSTAAQNETAQSTISAETTKIVDAINAAKSQATAVNARSDTGDDGQKQITDDMSNIILELQGTFAGVNGKFGDSYGNDLLTPIFGAVGGLLGTLDQVVVGIVGLVGGIVKAALGAVGGVLGSLLQLLFGFAAPPSHSD